MQLHLPSTSHLSLSLSLSRPFLGFRPDLPKFHPPPPSLSCSHPRISSAAGAGKGGRPRAKKKDNVWSVDNDLAARELGGRKGNGSATRRRRRWKTAGRARGGANKGRNDLVLVSAAMLTEVDTVLQTQEPVIKPAWSTFASSLCGIWKGVGAVFSPFTAEIEPIGIGNQNENLYDCYTVSRIERSPSPDGLPRVRRKTNWVALNPFGENKQHNFKPSGRDTSKKGASDVVKPELVLPSHKSFDFERSEVLEEDSMSMELGLVFFEDGSYSRGPLEIPVGKYDESKYFLSPTFKFEQCLVKGCHKRLRIVHTIEFSDGGSDIQIVRIAVYEEEWVSPVIYDGNAENRDTQVDPTPISQRRRTQPSELAGSWKVFEISATPIFNEEEAMLEEGTGPPYVYLCTEALKKRSLPESSASFGEEELLDMNNITVLWLPGGVTAYVDVNSEGILCIGVGWYSDEGINLVMERDYGIDGMLKEVRWKTEVKRRWMDSLPSP